MSTIEFLSQLRRLDIKLWADGERLRFDAPQGVVTPDLRAEIAARKVEILAFLRAAADTTSDTGSSIAPAGRGGPLPLSFTQQRLWFLDQLEPGSTAYIIPAAVRLAGPLDIQVLEQSLNAIVQRHEILRTTFTQIDGQPVQVIAPAALCRLTITELCDLAAAEQERAAQQLVREATQQPFDLVRGPLLRACLLRLGAEDHVLVLTMHHIVSDGWSMGVFVQEFVMLYRSGCMGQPLSLPPLPIQYADYAIWQRAWLQGSVLERYLAYWRQRLDCLPALDLPTDRPRPAIQSFCGAIHRFTLPMALTAALDACGQRAGCTLFMTLLAAFQVLLARYSGQDAIVVGTPIANRTRVETEGLIGCFVNTLVLRTSLADNPSFGALLERVREVCLGAYAHQDLPFEQLVEALQPTRDLSRNPLFQVMFAVQNAPLQAAELPDLQLRAVAIEGQTAKFDLSLFIVEQERELVGNLEYATDLFDASTIARMAEHFQLLLESFVAAAEQRVLDAPLLTDTERRQMLTIWNATAMDYPRAACIPDRFEAQVLRTPDAVAVCFEDQRITYHELNRRANHLAHHLRARGIGPEMRVGIYLERSVDLVVGLLGILKAGGAYVPLDPSYPAERLAFMLADAQARVLVTDARLSATLPEHTANVVWMDADRAAIMALHDENPHRAITPDNPAYVIYTSGSTGTPKGVMVTHGNVINFFAAMDDRVAVEQPGVWLAATSISFDISVLELFWTLTRGFQVVIQGEPERTRAVEWSGGAASSKTLAFSLFYFASDDAGGTKDKYRLLIEGAKFADRHGFIAIWTPERHFHAFGGLYPNPSITSAAIATITERLRIRAGSVVLPLHSPIRVAEEWSVIDNLSQGRVGISFASGWHANDFVFAPGSYADRKSIMVRDIETVRKLWRGESVSMLGGAGQMVEVQIQPQPIQAELPTWLTAAGNPETFQIAGAMGANILTHLLGQRLEDLAAKIALYRAARSQHGHDPATGQVTLMLHTFIGEDVAVVRETVRVPFCNYLRSSLDLIRGLARGLGLDIDSADFTEDDMLALLEHAFDRYFVTSGLFGTPDTCQTMIAQLRAIGVDEVACLIDFGVDFDLVMSSLQRLNILRERSAPPTAAADDQYMLAAQIARQHVSHLQCTPSMAQMLMIDPRALESLRSLQTLLLGGEALPVSLAAQVRAALPATILNMYGPTETCIWSATHRIDGIGSTIPIGRPIANTALYILDRRLQPVPIGVPGQLYIGGLGVARGYLNRPTLTAEKFIPDHFSRAAGARMYRTGDLARYRADGAIEFLGRLDHQVKIRGYRVELGEIEAALEQHPNVRAAVVLAREDSADDRRLVAYVVVEQNSELAPLRAFLSTKLPEYMIPAAFVHLDAMPLTPNGKIDRGALPAPEQLRPDLEATFVAPRTPAEVSLAEIWARLLRLERVGIHDNFFELGGHSLLATRLIAEVRDAFQVEVPLRRIFERPTIAGLAAAIAQHHDQRQDGLLPAITRAERGTEPIPLSFAQQRLWFLDQLEPGKSTYTMPSAMRLRGQLNRVALEQALNTIVGRHEVLRTTFALADGQPAQIIAPAARRSLATTDLCELPAPERESTAQRLALAEAQRPFDLAAGPLLRVNLLQIDVDDNILLVNFHHSISDGWSVGIFFQELATLYQAAVTGQPVELPALPIQYVDYTLWQRAWLQGLLLEQHLTYWRRQLADLPTLDVPTDYPRPPMQSFRGNRWMGLLSRTLTDALIALSRSEGATLFMTLLAAFQVLLARYSGQDDIVVGTPIAGRAHRELEHLIGFFANTLVVRTDLAGAPTFRAVLARVREACLATYAHQDLPFEKLVEALQPQRDLSRNPLFQVLFGFHNMPEPTMVLPGLTVDQLGQEHTVARFDLALDLRERPEGLRCSLEYNTDLFDTATAERMGGHFQSLLESIVDHPDQRIADLALLTKLERHQLLVEWNDTRRDYPRARCVHELFEDQAARRPEAVAITFAGTHMTYRALNERANRLAHYLKRLGVGPEVRVGICVERSLELVIGLLGILKAGGAFVPLDPYYPSERLAFMLEDSRAPVLLTQKSSYDLRFTGYDSSVSPAVVVDLEADWETIAQEPVESPASGASAGNLAYVIYTSGSTGQPKGVQICHYNVVNLLTGTQPIFEFSAGDVWTVVHSYAFDLSVWELWGCILHGGRMVVVPLEVAQSPAAFYALLRADGITILNQTPSAIRGLLETKEAAEANAGLALRLIMCGGEALPRDLALQLLTWDIPLWNFYGPTEATVWTSVNKVQAIAPQYEMVPIGAPLANSQLYVLDTALHLVPVGVPGELCIGGDGLARGYFERPALTAERFIPHPFSSDPGARLYKTGDVVRLLPGGEIEFLGRLDHQVKIRGFRIELGEIAATLRGLADVQDAVVVARPRADEPEQLVAYVVPKAGAPLDSAALRAGLQRRLPLYMLPARFVELAALPLTPNGKIDRQALPAPDRIRSVLDGFVSPTDPLELHLAHIWEDLLAVQPIGITDNFFELGGHSLLAVRLVAQIHQRFGQALPLSILFQGATIEELADIIRQQSPALFQPPLVGIQPSGTRRPFFCVHPLWGSVLCYVDLARQLGADQPVYGLQSPMLPEDQTDCRIEDMAHQYIESLRAVQPHGPYLLGGWSMGGIIAFEMARQLDQSGERVALLAIFDSPAPMADAVYQRANLDDTRLLAEFIHELPEQFQLEVTEAHQELLARFAEAGHTPNEFLALFWEHAHALGLLPPDVELTQLQQLFLVFRRNVRALARYLPLTYPRELTLFRGSGRKTAANEDPALGWSDLALGGVNIQAVPGEHTTIIRPPNVAVLAEQLRTCFAAARTN